MVGNGSRTACRNSSFKNAEKQSCRVAEVLYGQGAILGKLSVIRMCVGYGGNSIFKILSASLRLCYSALK